MSIVRCQVGEALDRVDHVSRRVAPSLVCLNECDCEASMMEDVLAHKEFCAIKKMQKQTYTGEYYYTKNMNRCVVTRQVTCGCGGKLIFHRRTE